MSVVESADTIRSGAQEISTASDDLSRRTEQQAASLEETTATLNEVTTTVKQSAEGTSHAREVVTAADNDAKQSAVVVREAVDAMSAIAKSSREISQIIGVIDEIAFQTNLLALTPASRRRGRERRDAGSPSSPPRCARSPNVRPKRPSRSKGSFPIRPARSTRASSWWRKPAARLSASWSK